MSFKPEDSAFPDKSGSNGVNIRAYLAAAALTGIMADGKSGTHAAAAQAVQVADAVIAELNKAPGSSPRS